MFERPVSIEGVIYRQHEAVRISHERGGTTVRVCSKSGHESKVTQHLFELDVGMTFAQAEAAVMELPFFAEVDDPLRPILDELAGILTDEQALSVPSAYPEWEAGRAYAAGDRRRWEGRLYRCLQAHTSQEGQAPDTAVSLWAAIIASTVPDQPLPWVQPDSTNAYMQGDRVTHADKVWESDIDYNVFEPGVAGWSEVDE